MKLVGCVQLLIFNYSWWTYDVIKPPFWIFWRPSWRSSWIFVDSEKLKGLTGLKIIRKLNCWDML